MIVGSVHPENSRELKKLKLLNCNYCKSKNIDKTLMAPNLKSKNNDELNINVNNIKELKKQIQIIKFIKIISSM